MAAVIEHLPQKTCDDLHALLGVGLALPTPTELRERQVGLLYELIEESGGDTPTAQAYIEESLRPERAGEEWPTPSQLSAAYGSWFKACAAAFRLWEEGSHARVAHTNQHAQPDYALYRRQHVTESIHRFRVRFGYWPDQWEYDDWARLRRRVARLTGSTDPRLPSLPRVTKLCSSWDRALALAIRAW